MQTPDSKKRKSIQTAGAKEILPVENITLPSGAVATCIRAKGKHVMEAQRLMDGDPEKMVPALMSICTTFEGKRLPMEDYFEMEARDFMALMGHYSPAFM